MAKILWSHTEDTPCGFAKDSESVESAEFKNSLFRDLSQHRGWNIFAGLFVTSGPCRIFYFRPNRTNCTPPAQWFSCGLNDHPSPCKCPFCWAAAVTKPGHFESCVMSIRITHHAKQIRAGEISAVKRANSPFVLVEFSGKLAKKERKFISATVSGDLKRILRFLGNLLAFEGRLVRSRVTGLPFF